MVLKFNSLFPSITLLTVLFAFPSEGWPASFDSYHLSKTRLLIQDTSAPPSEESPNFGFSALAFYTPEDAEVEASITLPGDQDRTFLSLGWIPGSMELVEDYYSTFEQLNADFPSGKYLFQLNPDTQTTQSATLELGATVFPESLTLINFEDLQMVDPGQDLELNWMASTLAGEEDSIQVTIYGLDGTEIVYRSPDPGLPGALPATTTSLTIPANTLPVMDSCILILSVHDVITTDITQIQGVTGSSSFASLTSIDFVTAEGFVPDTTPPIMMEVDPPIGATGVNTRASVAFTFSEPMADSIAIHWSPELAGGEYLWSEDQLTLTYTPQDSFGSGQIIRWTLNPDPDSRVFTDLAGNPMPMNEVTGSFLTSAGQLGTAPPEWLPGPTSTIELSRSANKTGLRFAAESLEGYQVQSSTDIKHWNTIERIRSNGSLIELEFPLSESGEPAFYRAARFGIPPAILMEETLEASTLIDASGGSLTVAGSDGTVYTLTIPPGALLAPTSISMIPLADIDPFPLSGGMIAGVELQPDGLSLLVPAELRMKVPGALDPVDLVGFNAKSNGFDLTWHPWKVESGNEIVLQLVHFSVKGAGHGSQEERDNQPPACDPLARLDQAICHLAGLAAAAFAQGDDETAQEYIDAISPLIQEIYDSQIVNAFKAAKKNRNLLPCAIYDYLEIEGRWQLFNTGELGIPSDADAGILHAWTESLQNCTTKGDFREIGNLGWLYAVDQLLGTMVIEDDFLEAIADCLSFKVDFRSETYYQGFLYKGHHVVEAKDVELTNLTEAPAIVTGSGPLVYKTVELDHNFPGCEPDIKDISMTDGSLEIWHGFITTPEFTQKGCDCENKTMDPDGWNKLDFVFILTFSSPEEHWQESAIDLDGSCYYFSQDATQWKDSLAVTHEKDIVPDLTGEFYEPLSLVISDFDFLNTNSGGRRKVAQKQISKIVPGISTSVFPWDFEDVVSSTQITIWYDPPASGMSN